jgi:hypothetical protein
MGERGYCSIIDHSMGQHGPLSVTSREGCASPTMAHSLVWLSSRPSLYKVALGVVLASPALLFQPLALWVVCPFYRWATFVSTI